MSLFFFLFMSLMAAGQPPAKPPLLIVLAIDVSQSAKPVAKPSEAQLQALASWVQGRGRGGTLAIALIGNPSPHDRQYVRCDLMAFPAVDPNAVLTEQVTARERVRRVLSDNQRRANQWTAQYVQRVNHYKPNGPELSNVSEMLTKAAILLHEPRYRTYQKVFVYVSDLRNEPRRSNVVESWPNPFEGIANLLVIGTGAKPPHPLTTQPNAVDLADIGGLVANLQTLIP